MYFPWCKYFASRLWLKAHFKKKKKTFRAFESRDEWLYELFIWITGAYLLLIFNYILNINSNWKMIKHNTEKQ